VRLWQLPDRTLEKRLDHDDTLLSVTFAPDGQKLAASLDSGLISLSAPDYTLIHQLNQDSEYVQIEALAFTSDSSILGSGSREGKIELWDPNEGTLLETLAELDQAVYSLAFTPDGQLLAAATDAHEVPVWNLADDTLQTLSGHSYKVWLFRN
jgi:WD40 repeat protein